MSLDVGGHVALPAPRLDGPISLETTLYRRRSVRGFGEAALDLDEVAQVLWSAQGVTHAEGYRTAPSAGATYPLELYLVVGNVTGLAADVYHYGPAEHRLTRVAPGDRRTAVAAAAPGQDWIATAPAALVFATVQARVAARYADRAGLYTDIEVGHATQSVYLQVTAGGLVTCLVGAFDSAALQQALDLPSDHVPAAVMPFGRSQ